MLANAWARQLARPSGLLGRLAGGLMNRWNRELSRSALDALAVRPGDHVLEIGFGGGASLAPLLYAAGKGGVAGLELSELMLARARRRYRWALETGRLELRLGNVERMPFGDEVFDCVLSANTIYFWPDLARALREIHRVLRPGGRLVLAFRPRDRLQRQGADRLGFTLREDREIGDLLHEAHLRLVSLERREDERQGHVVAVAEKSARAG